MNGIIEQTIWLAICIYHEARGELRAGQVAVGHVILNRVRKLDYSVKDIVLKPFQFSWANSGKRPPIKDYQSFVDCCEAAFECFGERLKGEDFEEADHYFADYIPPPSWSEGMTLIKKIGKHSFYRA